MTSKKPENPDTPVDIEASAPTGEDSHDHGPEEGDGDGVGTEVSETSEPGKLPSHVVGVGASAGGLEALERFFRALPVNTGMAFVVIQHLSPDFKSMMKELLARYTALPVNVVVSEMALRPNNIYLMPPGMEILARERNLLVRERSKDGVLFLPINVFFRSLAASWGERAIGIVLSGTGSDGSHGVLDIRDAGGVVLVESLSTARFSGMPQSAIATGCADAVLEPEEMPGALLTYISDPTSLSASANDEEDGPETTGSGGISDILDLLKTTFRADFSDYKPGTINRRIERRVALGNLTLGSYKDQLSANRESLNQLYKDLLIGVTKFFRDPESFEVLRKKIIPEILAQVPPGEEIRIWDCGCSTGEEAYSIAILFLEALKEARRPINLKILATDLHSESIAKSSSGVYSGESLSDTPAELRTKYFESLGDHLYRVTPELRRTLVFSMHNVISDPPFTKMNLVVCRNLLIYLKNDAQLRALSSFYYSLQMNSYLFLGSSENLGDIGDRFQVVDRLWKFFKKNTNDRLPIPIKSGVSDMNRSVDVPRSKLSSPLAPYYDILLTEYVPDGFLISSEGDVLHVFGNGKRFQRQQTGATTTSVNDFLVSDLHLPIASGIRTVQRREGPMVLPGIAVNTNGNTLEVLRLVFQPINAPARKAAYLVTMTNDQQFVSTMDATRVTDAKIVDEQSAPVHRLEMGDEVRHYVSDLEAELARTRESLQATVEELEASNEELQASNEELLASNEELQSTNEELHSVNEELYSVNAEHEIKIEELHQTTSDLRNLMRSTNTITLFVDQALRIRLFTPKVFDIISLLPQDIGRDVRHFKTNITDPTLFADIEATLANNNGTTRYLPQTSGQSYLRTCSVYQDMSGEPVGVVINYQDTSVITKTQSELERTEATFESILSTAPDPILVVSESKGIIIANKAAENALSTNRVALQGTLISKVIGMSFKQVAEAASEVSSREMEVTRMDDSHFQAEMRVGKLKLSDELLCVVYLTDITERKQAERSQLDALNEAEHLAKSRANFLATVSHEIRTPLNAIVSSSALLDESHVPEKERPLLESIKTSSQSLLQLVNDILDLSRIESGRIDLNAEPFTAEGLIQQVFKMGEPEALERGLTLKMVSGTKTPRQLFGEAGRIKQILTNLISNAIKFTSRGSVTVKTNLHNRGDVHQLEVSVSDTGIGISQEHQTLIFEPFAQVDSAANRRHTGTGLGLSIARQMVNLLGGDISVKSELGVGSTFKLTVPVRLESEAKDGELTTKRTPLQIWSFVQPSQRLTALQPAENIFEWSVHQIDDSSQWLSSIQDANIPPDILLINGHMHDEERAHFSSVIEHLKAGGAALPAVFEVVDEPRAESTWEAMSANTLLIRTSAEELFTRFANAMIHSERASTARLYHGSKIAAFKYRWLRDINVLVVDDNETNLMVNARVLERLGANCVTASSGSEALALLKEQNVEFDVALLDIQMPIVDGFMLAKQIRAIKRFEVLPLIAVTGDAVHSRRVQAFQVGFSHFLMKPTEADDLLSAIRIEVEHARRVPLPIQRVTNKNTTYPTLMASKLTSFDLDALQARTGLEFKAALGLLEKFNKDLADLAPKLATSLQAENRQAAKSIVHSLKSAAGNVNATELFEFLKSLHADLYKEDSGLDYASTLHQFQILVSSVMENLKALEEESPPDETSGLAHSNEAQEVSPLELMEAAKGIAQQVANRRKIKAEQIEPFMDAAKAHFTAEELETLRVALDHYDYKQANNVLKDMIKKLSKA